MKQSLNNPAVFVKENIMFPQTVYNASTTTSMIFVDAF